MPTIECSMLHSLKKQPCEIIASTIWKKSNHEIQLDNKTSSTEGSPAYPAFFDFSRWQESWRRVERILWIVEIKLQRLQNQYHHHSSNIDWSIYLSTYLCIHVSQCCNSDTNLLGEGQVGIKERLYGSNVLPVVTEQVSLMDKMDQETLLTQTQDERSHFNHSAQSHLDIVILHSWRNDLRPKVIAQRILWS